MISKKTNNISIYLNIVFLIFFLWYFVVHVGVGTYYRKYISPKETFIEDIYYQAEVNAYADLNRELKPEKEYDVFVGDSLIEQFPVYELYPEKNVLNRGIGLDTTYGLLKRLENTVNNIKIRNCFLMIGHNDLKFRSAKETLDNIELIISRIKADKIYFISILPTFDLNYNEQIKHINQNIEALSAKSKFHYIDMYDSFTDSTGKLKHEYSYDGTHLRLSGYLVFKAKIESYLVQI